MEYKQVCSSFIHNCPKKGTNPNAHQQENDPFMAYSHKAMPHSNRKNTPLVHATTKRNLTKTLSKRGQTKKEHLLSDSSYVKFKTCTSN